MLNLILSLINSTHRRLDSSKRVEQLSSPTIPSLGKIFRTKIDHDQGDDACNLV